MTSLIGLLPNDTLVLTENKSYQLQEVVSRGGSSIVYLACTDADNSPDRYVIIKELFPRRCGIKRGANGTLIIPELQRDKVKKIRLRAEREAEIVEELRDDRKRALEKKALRNLDGKIDKNADDPANGETNSDWFMSYAKPIEKYNTLYTVVTTRSGKVLSKKIEKGDFANFNSACDCVLKILKALEPIHGLNGKCLHLDIAPDNIHVSAGTGIFRLIDFNSAFRPGVDDLLDWNPTFKEGYSAHELASFEATKPLDLCPATDLYSVAAIFFELLIGRPPQADDGDSLDEWPQWISESKCLTGASNRLVKETADFLLRGLSSWSKNRFESVTQMQEAIEHIKGLNEGYRLKNRPKYPNKYFVCRKSELEGIHESLKKESYVILEGMGGIGKTELAKRYTQRYKDDYDFVQLVTFNGSLESTIATSLSFDNFDKAMDDWYTKTYGDQAVSKMYEAKIAFLKKDKEDEKHTLIIIDNYDPPELYDGKFDEFVSANYRIIFTSRNALRGKARLKIGAMHDKADLLDLFYAYYDSPKLAPEDEATVNDIIDLVLGHTMTVMLIASTMRQGEKTPKEMLERLQNSLDPRLRTEIAVDKEGLSDEDRKQVMYGHIKTLFDMEKIKPDVDYSYIMTNMALVPYEGLKKKDFYEYALKGHYESQGHIDAYYDDLDYLIDRYWVQSSDGKVSLHPVISDVVYKDEDLSPDSQKCVALIESLIKLTKDHESETHVAWANSMSMLKLACERITDESGLTTYLLNTSAHIANSLADYDMALEYYRKVSGICENILGKENPATAVAYGSMAFVYTIQGDYSKALKLDEKALAIYEKAFDNNHLYIAHTYGNMAVTYLNIGDYPKALELNEKSLAIQEKVLGKECPDVATTYATMADVYFKQGDYPKALSLHERALTIRKEVLGKEHPLTAATYDSMATIYSCHGNYSKALGLYEIVLAIREKVLGKEHPDVAITYNNLAINYSNMGDLSKALELHERALAIREKVLGKEHPDTAKTYGNIANIYSKRGDYLMALKLNKKALGIYEEVLGKEHPDIAIVCTNMALDYFEQGDYPKALELFQKALGINEKVLSKEHPYIVFIYNNMALSYSNMGNWPMAQEMYRKVLAIREKALGKEHPDTTNTYDSMAFVYSNMGNYSKALELCWEVLAIRKNVLGKEHPHTTATYNNIAMVYSSQGDYLMALEMYREVLAVHEKIAGKEHPGTAITYSNMATVYLNMGDCANALRWYKKTLAIFEKVLGEEHPDIVATYDSIATVYCEQSDYPKALEWYQKVLVVCEKVAGNEHLLTAINYNNIARVYDKQGDYSNALEWYRKAMVIREKALGKDHPSVIELHDNIARLEGEATSD